MQSPDVSELQVSGLIGTGACGKVYRARDAAGREVAVKIFAEPAVNRELLEEAALRLEAGGWPAGALEEISEDYRGRQIVRVTPFLADEKDGEWIPRSLQHRLDDFPGEESWPMVRGVLKALAALHDCQVAHGNLKPGNVFIDDGGEVVLTDWALGNMPGIVGVEYTDAVLYQSPDQLRDPSGFLKEQGYRWDVFAFAVLAYRLATGAFPRCTETFDDVAPEPGKTRREDIAANFKQVAKAVEAHPTYEWPDAAANRLEQTYREILDRCLSLDPKARPANAGEVLRLFNAADENAAHEKHRDAILDQQRRARRSAWRANVATGVLAGVVAILSILWRVKSSELAAEEAGRKSDVAALEADRDGANEAAAALASEVEAGRKSMQYEKDRWLARIEASRAAGDHLFSWAMEKGHRRLPPLDGRELRLKRLELYFQDFITRTAEIPELKEERANARLQLAEVTLAKGDPQAAAGRLEEAMASSADLPSGPDLDLRLATDRLLLALLLQDQNSDGTEAAFAAARGALEAVPQAEVDADRVLQLLAVLDFHESRLLAARGKDDEALAKLLGATQVLNQLVDQRPDSAVLRSELVSCYLSSATILDGIGKMGDAREVRSLASEDLLALLKEDPGNLDLRQELAGCYGAVAEAAVLSGDVAAAESNSQAATRLLEALLLQRPESPEVRARLAAQRGLAAGILRDRGKADEARELIEEGILLVEQIAVGKSADPVAKYRLSLLLWQKGRMIGAAGDREEEIALESRAVEMLRKIAKSDYSLIRAEQIRRSMAYVLGDLGHAAELAGKGEQARNAFSEAVSVWTQLDRSRPNNEEYEEGLAYCAERLKEL